MLGHEAFCSWLLRRHVGGLRIIFGIWTRRDLRSFERQAEVRITVGDQRLPSLYDLLAANLADSGAMP